MSSGTPLNSDQQTNSQDKAYLEKGLAPLYDATHSQSATALRSSHLAEIRKVILKSIALLLLILFSATITAQLYENEYKYVDEEDVDSLPHVEIKLASDLQALGRQALAERKVIFLELSASYCGYCKTLEEHIIKPMIRSGDYSDYVLIRKMDIDSHFSIKDFDGSKTSPAQYAYKLNAQLTPTLLFIDGRGKEVSERILGVNTLELYGGYVDAALLQGHRRIKQQQ